MKSWHRRTSERSSDDWIIGSRRELDARFGPDALTRLHDRLIRTTVLRGNVPQIRGLDPDDCEFVIRQICYQFIYNTEDLNHRLIAAVAAGRPLSAPLPKTWRDVVTEQGFRVAAKRSAVLWSIRVFRQLLRGICVFGFHLLRATVPRQRTIRSVDSRRTAYLHSVAPENLPIGLPDLPGTDFVSWLEERTNILYNFDAIATRVRVNVPSTRGGRKLIGRVRPLMAPRNFRELFRFFAIATSGIARSAAELTRGRWALSLLSVDLVDLALIRATCGQGHPSLHLFNLSQSMRRPLWTTCATHFEIKVLFYHYSVNSETFWHELQNNQQTGVDSWRRLVSWGEQLVWDSRHAEFLQSGMERRDIFRVVGPISFVASSFRLPSSSRNCIGLFDVTPMSRQWLATWPPQSYVTQELIEGFILGVIEVAPQFGLTVYWKSKREVTAAHDPAYASFRNMVGERPGVSIISHSASAQQVIAASCAAISLPFTSTALIAHAAGKPSAFYDPSGSVRPDHPAGRGLPVLSSEDALRAWLGTVASNGTG